LGVLTPLSDDKINKTKRKYTTLSDQFQIPREKS